MLKLVIFLGAMLLYIRVCPSVTQSLTHSLTNSTRSLHNYTLIIIYVYISIMIKSRRKNMDKKMRKGELLKMREATRNLAPSPHPWYAY